MLVGLSELLSDEGAEVVGETDQPSAILFQAERLRPDVVMLGLEDGSRDLGQRVQAAAPGTKVIFWSRDERRMEVLDAGSSVPREVCGSAQEGLRSELDDCQANQAQE